MPNDQANTIFLYFLDPYLPACLVGTEEQCCGIALYSHAKNAGRQQPGEILAGIG